MVEERLRTLPAEPHAVQLDLDRTGLIVIDTLTRRYRAILEDRNSHTFGSAIVIPDSNKSAAVFRAHNIYGN